MSASRAAGVLAALLLLVLAPGRARAAGVRLGLLGGEVRRDIRVEAITKDEIRFVGPEGKPERAALDEVVSLTFPGETGPAAARDPDQVEVVFRNGDLVHGRLVPGKQDRVAIDSPLLGPLDFPVDDVARIHFLDAWSEVPEKPSFRGDSPDLDLFYYRSLDHVEGTWMNVSPDHVVVRRSSGPEQEIEFKDLLVIRFANAPAPPAPKSRITMVLLSDGTRITASTATSDGHVLRLETPSGTALKVDLSEVRSLYVKGGRFVYLSDLAPAKITVTPWIGRTYAWDRPRMDRSFLDRPLRACGESFLKGIGAISGTSISWDLDGKFDRFTSLIALDDAAGEEGDVRFVVLLDGEKKFESEVIRHQAAGEKPVRIPPIDVSGAHRLTLEVKWVDDWVMDFADWIEPMLIRSK